jgi:hypothetical protein
MAGTQQDNACAVAEQALAPNLTPAGGRPLLGWLGRTLEMLFPPAPAPPPRTRSRGRTLRTALAYAGVLGLGAGVLLIRQAGTPSWSTLWAEDGSVFLPRALAHPWSSLFHEQAGYLQLVPQLIADIVARFPARPDAAGFAIAGALVASCCAIFVYHASSGHIHRPGLRALLACSVLLLPTAVIEIANSGVDAPWYLMYALFWALIWRPRSRPGQVAAAAFAFVTMASNILNLLYLPLVAARVVALPRAREQAVTFGWLAGIAYQVPGILQSREPDHIGPVPAAFHFYGQHVLVAAVAGWRLALRLQAAAGIPAAIAIAALMVAAVVAWAAWQGGSRVRVLTVAALGMGVILTVVPALLRPWIGPATSTNIWVPGSRYTTSAILLIDGIAIAGVDAFLRRTDISLRPARRATVVLLLVIGLGIGWSTSFRYPNLRSGNASLSQAHAAVARNHDAGRTVVPDPPTTNVSQRD